MPELERITIKGFKSIRELQDFELRSLNVLIGPNASGKSNFLELFQLLGSIREKNLQLFVERRNGPDALLFGTRKRTRQIYASLKFGKNEYRFSLEPTRNRFIFKSEEVVYFGGIISENRYDLGEGHDESKLDDAAKIRSEQVALHPQLGIRPWQVYHFHDTSDASPIRRRHSSSDNMFLRRDGRNIGPFLRFIHDMYPTNYRDIVDTIHLAFPSFREFFYRHPIQETTGLEWKDDGISSPIYGPSQMSDGTLRLTCLATLLLQPVHLQPSLILIDEPELGLHPSVIGVVCALIKRASLDRQIIVATQSADLLSGLDLEDIVVVDIENNESRFRRLTHENLEAWLKDFSLADLWRMNVLGGGPY